MGYSDTQRPMADMNDQDTGGCHPERSEGSAHCRECTGHPRRATPARSKRPRRRRRERRRTTWGRSDFRLDAVLEAVMRLALALFVGLLFATPAAAQRNTALKRASAARLAALRLGNAKEWAIY